MYNEYFNFARQGWQCPICHKIFNPSQYECPYCNAQRKIFNTTTTGTQITPFDDAGWWDDYMNRSAADSAINIGKNGTIVYTSSAAPENHLEDELSWRDWLDEMRAQAIIDVELKENK